MSTTFRKPINNFSSTIASTGSGTVTVATGDGTNLGSLASNQVYALTIVRNPGSSETIIAIVEATGRTGDQLTGVTAVEGTSLGGIQSGDTIQCRETAKSLTDLATAVNGLEALSIVSVTTATTLGSSAFGKSHLCSGTSANYTVALPSPTGHSGESIEFVMVSGLTKIVTLDAGSGKTIDGSQSRPMRNGESATLRTDGTNWYKVAGKSVPFHAVLRRGSDQSAVVTGAVTKVLIDTAETGSDTLAVDASNNRLLAPRDGYYEVSAAVQVVGISANATRIIASASSDGSATDLVFAEASGLSGGFPMPVASRVIFLTASSPVYLVGYQTSGANQTFAGSTTTAGVCYLEIKEVPTW